jgi:hypothetical protein
LAGVVISSEAQLEKDPPPDSLRLLAEFSFSGCRSEVLILLQAVSASTAAPRGHLQFLDIQPSHDSTAGTSSKPARESLSSLLRWE